MSACTGMLGKRCTCGDFHDTRPTPLILAPGVIDGPEDRDDFMKQDNALTAVLLWGVRPLAIATFSGFAAYFICRAAGLL